MASLESILRDAQELSFEDREFLVLQLRLSLQSEVPEVDEQGFIDEMRRISDHAREHPETTMDWEEARRRIFGAERGA